MTEQQALEYEKGRVDSLISYSILDTLPEKDYDNLTAIAASICRTPVSLISLVDEKRQWFKSNHGLPITETDRAFSFCAHAIKDPLNLFTVKDASADERFADNPYVSADPPVIFYAGVPLINKDGFALGTLCVIDHKPRQLDEQQVSGLIALAKQAMNLMELRKARKELEAALVQIKERNEELERFAYVAAHDLKTPIVNIISMGHLFLKLYANQMDARGKEILDIITYSASNLTALVDGLLEYSKCDKLMQEKKQSVNIDDIRKEIASIFYHNPEVRISLVSELQQIVINKTVLSQLFNNLVSNAVKYNDKAVTEIEIGIADNQAEYVFYVKDNGPGIPARHHKKIFSIFEVLTSEDRFGNRGNGIGLATVKKLVDNMKGSIRVISEPGSGTCFHFTIPV